MWSGSTPFICKTGNTASIIGQIQQVDTQDPLTAVITWKTAFAGAAAMDLRTLWPYPAHLLAVKQRVLMTSLPDIAPTVARILKTDEPEKMQSLIERLNG